MKGNKLIGVILLVVGVALLVFGFNASQSVGEQLSETFTGRFSDETMVYLIGGAVATILGLVLTLRR